MTTRDEVLREFPHRDVARHGLRIHRLADEIVRLRKQLAAVTQERDEDQGVIAVWRGRTERAENRTERMTSVFLAAKEWYDIQDDIASGFAEMKDFNRCESELVKAMEDYYATEKRET